MHEKFRRPFPEGRKKSVHVGEREREIADESKDRYHVGKRRITVREKKEKFYKMPRSLSLI